MSNEQVVAREHKFLSWLRKSVRERTVVRAASVQFPEGQPTMLIDAVCAAEDRVLWVRYSAPMKPLWQSEKLQEVGFFDDNAQAYDLIIKDWSAPNRSSWLDVQEVVFVTVRPAQQFEGLQMPFSMRLREHLIRLQCMLTARNYRPQHATMHNRLGGLLNQMESAMCTFIMDEVKGR